MTLFKIQGQSVAGASRDPRGPFFVPSTSPEVCIDLIILINTYIYYVIILKIDKKNYACASVLHKTINLYHRRRAETSYELHTGIVVSC